MNTYRRPIPFHEGAYKTNLGYGVVSGPHKVRIAGFDRKSGPAPDGTLPQANPLFPEYITTIDIAKDASKLDFDVTAK